MSDTKALTTQELIDRYVAVWNEPDRERRRQTISELWAEDGIYVSAQAEFRGYGAIEDAVKEAHERFVGGGYVFKPSRNSTGHHNTLRFNWIMVPVGGDEVEAIGFDFFVLNGEGRIIADYQYIDKPPAF